MPHASKRRLLCFAALVLIWIPASTPESHGGVVVTRNRKVDIGGVSVTKDDVTLKTKYGRLKYPRDQVLWFDNNARIDSIYKAGLAAHKRENPELAKLLFERSMKSEPTTKEEAKDKIAELKEEMFRSSRARVVAAAAAAEKPDDVDEESDGDRKAGGGKNAFTRMIGANLIKLKEESVRSYEDRELADKDYYAIYYSAHWCGPCRQFTPKLVKFYNETKKNHADDFELIFVSRDRTSKAMKSYMKEAKMPWPAVEYDESRKTQLNKFAAGWIPFLALVDDTGKLRSRGKHNVLKDLDNLLAQGD